MHDRRILVGGRHAECVVKSLLFNALSSRDKREAEHLGGERRDLRYIILYTDLYLCTTRRPYFQPVPDVIQVDRVHKKRHSDVQF